MEHDSLVYQPSSSTEAVIQRTIDGIQRMISINNSQAPKKEEEKGDDSAIKINPAMKKHWELQIKILRDTPRDAEKVREILNENKKSMKKQRIVKT
jgi:uncharacterized protein YjaG (DUF416 family)